MYSKEAGLQISDWLVEYTKIVKSYNITDKTYGNRLTNIRWIDEKLGTKIIGEIKPYEIAIELKLEYKVHQAKAKRLLIEIKNMFMEAIIYGWIDKNPAMYLKAQPVEIQRERLSLEDWVKMYEYATTVGTIKWVPTMLLLALVTGQRRGDLSSFKYSDVLEDRLLIDQQKTGTKLAIPLAIRLNVINKSLDEVIQESKTYGKPGDYLIRKSTGEQPCLATLSTAFHNLVLKCNIDKNTSLHECRSLSERLYREQGINTRILLGHKHQSMTDMYNDDRGLTKDNYVLVPI